MARKGRIQYPVAIYHVMNRGDHKERIFCDDQDRQHRLFGHPFKVSLAGRLRTETTVTVDWIAQRLHMGTRGQVAHLLCLQEHSRQEPPSSDQPTLNL